MNTKIATTFGLAVIFAIGVITMLLIFGMFSAKPANADVGAISVTVTPNKARSIGQYTIAVSRMDEIPVGGAITVTFNAKTGVPSAIAASAIRLSATAVAGGGSPNQLVTAAAVTVSGRAVTITIPDMDSGAGTGDNNIGANAELTIIITQAAGIQNPDQASGILTLTVKTSVEPTAVTSFAYTIISFVSFSPSSAHTGETLTVNGGGFEKDCITCPIRFSPQRSVAPVTGAVGIGTIDANGVFSGTVSLTSSTSPGGYVWVTDSGGNSQVSSTKFRQFGLIPHVVLGTVTLDGVPAIEGTVVMAWVNGVQVASANVSSLGTYLLEIGVEMGYPGQTVVFRIGATTADQTIKWVMGGADILNLTASSSSCALVIEIALAPLGQNLLRVWHMDNDTKAWSVYDPMALDLSDLALLVQDRIYWIKVDQFQTLILCGNEVPLFPGWNLIHFADEQANPPPAVPTAEALAPLIEIDALVRAWYLENQFAAWFFFDPRPAFEEANTLRELVSGQVYQLKVNGNHLGIVLNGMPRNLLEGWNFITW